MQAEYINAHNDMVKIGIASITVKVDSNGA